MFERIRKESRVPLTICITVFLVTYFLNNDFNIRYIWNYAFVAAVIVCSRLFDGNGMIRMGKVTVVYLLLSGVVVVFSFLPNSVLDQESNNHAISIMLFALCAAFSKPSRNELRMSEIILLAFAIILAIYIVLIKVFPDIYWNSIFPYLSEYTQNTAVDLMKNHNYGVPVGGSANYADYILTLGLFICLSKLFSNFAGNIKAKICFVLSFLFILGMVIENRRGELIAAVLTIVVMYLLSMNFGRIETNRLFRAMAAVAIIAVGLVFMYARGMLDRYINTIVSLSSRKAGGIEEVGNGRIALWSLAIEKFFRSPIIGIGWNQFRATNDISFMEGINVHNDYLQWLCETGIIGFILILIPTLYLWFKTARRCRFFFANKAFYCNEARSYALVSFGIQNFFILLHFMDPCFYKLIFWPIYALSIILYNRSTFFATRTAGALEQEYAYNCLIEEARAV